MKNENFNMPALEEIFLRLGTIEQILESIQKQKRPEIRLLTTKEACIVLKVSLRTLQSYRDRGQIPFIQFGREVRFRPEDLQRFLLDHFIAIRGNQEGGEDEYAE
jgi:excisionase family DNA binding protein